MTNANCLVKFKENIGLVNSSSEIIECKVYKKQKKQQTFCYLKQIVIYYSTRR